MELLNICYKYINRFINSNELVNQLNGINKDRLTDMERQNIDELIKEIREISNSIPDSEDKLIQKEKETIKKLIKNLEVIPRDVKNKDFIDRQLYQLRKDYDRKYDSYEKWLKVRTNIIENEYFNNCYNNLSKYELLRFITQYIGVPLPPKLGQNEFDELVKVGIENSEKELLWRLALNYAKKEMNLDLIINYYILKQDGYYISELISAVGEYLNVSNIFDKINDVDLIKDLSRRKNVMNEYVKDEDWNKLMNKLEKESE